MELYTHKSKLWVEKSYAYIYLKIEIANQLPKVRKKIKNKNKK